MDWAVSMINCYAAGEFTFVMREFVNILLSPVNLGRTRWGNGHKSRMSLLSVVTFLLIFVVMIGGAVLKWLGFNLHGPTTMKVIFGCFALLFISGVLDDRRDRRRKFDRR